jgi:adenylate kinase family enzyme
LINLLIGVPGAGKGTFSNIFVKNLGWKTLSLGDLLRAGSKNI